MKVHILFDGSLATDDGSTFAKTLTGNHSLLFTPLTTRIEAQLAENEAIRQENAALVRELSQSGASQAS